MRKRSAVFGYALNLAGACAPFAVFALSAQVVYCQETVLNNLVQTYCVECHNLEDYSGSIDLEALVLTHVGEEPEVWETAIGKLRGRLMPPAGQPQPSQDEINSVVSYLESTIDASAADRRVGHVPIQRLNRTEFAASVKTLLGVEIDPAQALPADIEVEGFNNVAGALGISPSFMEQYLSAARSAARQAVGEPVPKLASIFYTAAGSTQGGPGGNPAQNNHRDGFPLGTRGGMSFMHVFPADGEYHFNFLDADNLNAGLYPFGMLTMATMVLLVDGVEVARRDIGGSEDLAFSDRDGPKGREAIVNKMAFTAQVKAGNHQIVATFIERSLALSNDTAGGGRISDMPVIKGGMQVDGPFSPQGLSMSDSRSRIFVCTPELDSEERACAENIAQHLATQAFRRTVTEADMNLLMKFYDAGRQEEGGFDAGVTELVTAVLSSPDFLYRAIQAAPQPTGARELNDLELASRLSFFLWSQGPDTQLLTLAIEGKLADPAIMEQQVARMLKDERAQALVENFALAWLNLDELEQIEPLEAGFNVAMRGNFETEMRLFLASVLLEDRSVHDLLNADYTFLNDALARHYGISGVLGPQFREVKLTDERRWGLLGKAAVLMRTSYGDRTSPVLRGAWVLDRIMGTPPTPPPPGVVTDLSIHEGDKTTTVRARLEKHRENPTCQACHGLIDPPGLALENFDVTGRWRDIDAAAQAPIDASSTLSGGSLLNGPIDLRHYLTSRPDQFPTTVTKRLMMYALNREIEYFDMPQIRQIVRTAAESNYTFAAIVNGIVNSAAFRNQGGEETATEQPTTSKAVASIQAPL